MNTPASTKVEQRHREYAAEACRFTGWKGAALSIERGKHYRAEDAEQRLMELFARFEATLTPAPSGEGREDLVLVPRAYTYAIGDAAQAYLKSKGGDDARLPGGFYYTELWDAMLAAALNASRKDTSHDA